MSVKVLHKQRIVDLAMQQYGDPSFIFDIALATGKSITDELDAVTELELPVLLISGTGKSIITVLQKPLNLVASADDNIVIPTLPPGGIGYMKIRDVANPSIHDFKIS